jgi:hypothetical protein
MLKDLITSSLPKYSLVNPRTKTKYWFRPMLVREEKKMLAAQELSTKEEIVKCVEEIVDSCFENLDSSKLPTFELDYFFITLRMKSIAETISAKFTCPETEEKINLNIDLNSLKIKNIEKYNPNVKISDDLMITFRLPTYKDTLSIKNENDYDDVLNLATSCVISITTPDQEYEITNENREELKEMFLNMKVTQFGKVVEFFDSIPVYEHVYEYQTSDGVNRKVVISGIEDFFTLASVI